MEHKKDEILDRKDGSNPSSGYFSTVFPSNPSSEDSSKDLVGSDLYQSLNKNNRSESQMANADRKYQGGSPIRGQKLYKDGKPVYPVETIDTSYFGSSVHYGGREFVSSPPKKASDTLKNYRTDEGGDLNNSNMATRGDWWQGSLYY